MNRLRNSRHGRRGAGVILIELLVAVMLTSIVVTVIYAAWARINRHTISHQRTTELHRECGRIAETITARLRRAEAVLHWDQNSVRFIASGEADTMTYSFDGQNLFLNGQPVPLLIRQASVSAFSLENQNRENPSQPFLFRITVSLSIDRGETATVSTIVMARSLHEQLPDNDFIW
jgi:type II secretory pathway component PulJ